MDHLHELILFVSVPTANASFEVEISGSSTPRQLLEKFIHDGILPSIDNEGRYPVYNMLVERTHKELALNSSLGSSGLMNGDTIIISPLLEPG